MKMEGYTVSQGSSPESLSLEALEFIAETKRRALEREQSIAAVEPEESLPALTTGSPETNGTITVMDTWDNEYHMTGGMTIAELLG
jgi:hypothetical protein